MRAPDELDVMFAFSQCQTGDAGFAMRRTPVMRRLKPVDRERLHPAPGKLVERGTPGGAQSDHNDIPASLHGPMQPDSPPQRLWAGFAPVKKLYFSSAMSFAHFKNLSVMAVSL